jgi:outer membrane protein
VIGTITLVATRAFATSLSLEDAIGRALAFAPSAAAAAAQSDLNSARVDEFRASMFPTIAANGEYNQTPGYDSVVTNRGLSLAQLGLNYTVFDGGRRSAQVRSARYAAEASALGIEAARSQIVFDTTSAYFDLARARQAKLNYRGSEQTITNARRQAVLRRRDYLAPLENRATNNTRSERT